MEPRDAALITLARRAYETGRLRVAACWTLRVAPMVILSLLVARGGLWSLLGGTALYGVVVALRWRGQSYGEAVITGLVAGSVPLLVPMIVPRSGHCCVGGTCLPICVAACVGAGLIAGLLVGVRAASHDGRRRAFLVAATSVAALAGSLGCVMMSAAGVLGMAAGLLIGSLPFALAVKPSFR